MLPIFEMSFVLPKPTGFDSWGAGWWNDGRGDKGLIDSFSTEVLT